MNVILETMQNQLKSLTLTEAAKVVPTIIQQAESEDWSYSQFLQKLLGHEQERREEKQMEKRLKWAAFPFQKTLQEFDLNEQQSLSRKQFTQLSELNWLDQMFNLILLGPPGVGKTHLAIGLGLEAIYKGYKVAFISMGELIHTLKTEEITRRSQARLKRIREANLVVIDDLMFMAMDSKEANLFFHLINELYNSASIILTSNKGPSDWGDLIGDPAITTAILDRIAHRSEIVHLNGDSYRMKHRTSIFGEKTVQK
ncbi:ATP-binding protein [Bacillus sp. BRMEA1]|uniref:IS21-like element helper ATPase IstB n=1 Tax=Neobacillus endophyticus TaxID=2738405 RepID=UPI0015665638|nr:IS21-like element helper ATPase IstB [Neobacillus endophyticus]NRD77658.1 ATP-binding protein [Neobacillus endophyticus]NRD78278.1 ATP-binding protein [Neobacillus endophyticus]NRD81003.1 ATP-binding protein [Neobacillus endophyticus]